MAKTIIIIITVIILGAVGWFVFKSSQLSVAPIGQDSQQKLVQGPQIQVSPDKYDFGTVIYGEVAEHEFVITNSGSQPLEILRLSTSCGCTDAFFGSKDAPQRTFTIAPDESMPLIVTFDPAAMKDNPDLGQVKRVVYIRSNDPNKAEVEINIDAFVALDSVE